MVRAWRLLPVTLWATILGPLLILMSYRRMYGMLDPMMEPSELAERTALMVSLGFVLAFFGTLSFLGGVLCSMRGRGAPALAQIGALMIAAGLVWVPCAETYMELWANWEGSLGELEEIRSRGEAFLRARSTRAIQVLAALFLPATLWSFRRDGWMGLSDGVAAGTLAVVFLSTGEPARLSVERTQSAWLTACAAVYGQNVGLESGDVNVVRRQWRVYGLDGDEGPLMEAPSDAGWTAGDEPIWIVDGDEVESLMDTLGVNRVTVAGWTPPPVPSPLFGEHPALVASRCRAHEVTRGAP